jgi:hypothetical protein
MNLIENEPSFKVEDGKLSASFSGRIEYEGRIKGVVLKIGTDSGLSDAEIYTTQLIDATFSTQVLNLNPNTEYLYCYSIDYGVSADYVAEIKNITTPPMLPTVVTEEVNSFGVVGNVTNDGGSYVTERGICWGKNPKPDTTNSKSSGEGTGTFMVDILPNLDPGETYYVRAYATNSVGTAYGDDILLLTKSGI